VVLVRAGENRGGSCNSAFERFSPDFTAYPGHSLITEGAGDEWEPLEIAA